LKGRTHRIIFGSGALVLSTFITFASGFILAGLLARYFTPEEFGLWGILISLNGIFINGFDWGFGNALRNKIAGLNVQANHEEGRTYFLSIFMWFILSAVILSALFWAIKPFVPWDILLKSNNPDIIDIGSSLFIIGGVFFALNIAFNLYSSGFFGYQESHWNALFNSISKLSILAVTVLLIFLGKSFFFINIATFSAILASSILGFASFLVIRKWPLIVVGMKRSIEVVKELWRKSAQFALLQVFSILLLNADLLVVSKASGLIAAGDYFIVKRLFLVVSTLHFALLLPIWSAYTESIESMDYAWAKKMLISTSSYTVVLFAAGMAGMMLFGRYIALLWTGKEISDPRLYLWMGVWSLFYGWNNCFSVFLNAIGRLKRQAILVSTGAIVFFPLGVLLGEHWGSVGICWALIVVSIPVAISNPLESYRIMRSYIHKSVMERG
jgi:O-antigen/teichoic acid export membrane protein